MEVVPRWLIVDNLYSDAILALYASGDEPKLSSVRIVEDSFTIKLLASIYVLAET